MVPQLNLRVGNPGHTASDKVMETITSENTRISLKREMKMNHYVTFWDLLVYTGAGALAAFASRVISDLRKLRKDRKATLARFAPPERTLEDTEP